MKKVRFLNAIFKIESVVSRYSFGVSRLFNKVFLGFGLVAVLTAGLSACSAKLVSPIVPVEPLSDGVPITGIDNPLKPFNYFTHVQFLRDLDVGDQGPQGYYPMSAVHECFQITDAANLLGRLVAISTAPANDPTGAQNYFWYYEGVRFLGLNGQKDRNQSTTFGHYAFSNQESEATQTGNIIQSFSVGSSINQSIPFNGPGSGQPSEMDATIKWTADGYELTLASTNTVRIWDPAALSFLGLNNEVQFTLQCDSAPR
jgi:hypothetical protein